VEIHSGMTVDKIERALEVFNNEDLPNPHWIILPNDKKRLTKWCLSLGFNKSESKEIVKSIYERSSLIYLKGERDTAPDINQ